MKIASGRFACVTVIVLAAVMSGPTADGVTSRFNLTQTHGVMEAALGPAHFRNSWIRVATGKAGAVASLRQMSVRALAPNQPARTFPVTGSAFFTHRHQAGGSTFELLITFARTRPQTVSHVWIWTLSLS